MARRSACPTRLIAAFIFPFHSQVDLQQLRSGRPNATETRGPRECKQRVWCEALRRLHADRRSVSRVVVPVHCRVHGRGLRNYCLRARVGGAGHCQFVAGHRRLLRLSAEARSLEPGGNASVGGRRPHLRPGAWTSTRSPDGLTSRSKPSLHPAPDETTYQDLSPKPGPGLELKRNSSVIISMVPTLRMFCHAVRSGSRPSGID